MRPIPGCMPGTTTVVSLGERRDDLRGAGFHSDDHSRFSIRADDSATEVRYVVGRGTGYFNTPTGPNMSTMNRDSTQLTRGHTAGTRKTEEVAGEGSRPVTSDFSGGAEGSRTPGLLDATEAL